MGPNPPTGSPEKGNDLEAMILIIVPGLVVPQRSRYRKGWEVLMAFLLVYTGTIFPMRLAFWEFQIKPPEEEDNLQAVPGLADDLNEWFWFVWGFCVDGFFLIGAMIGAAAGFFMVLSA